MIIEYFKNYFTTDDDSKIKQIYDDTVVIWIETTLEEP
jgi:hypothetical protein